MPDIVLFTPPFLNSELVIFLQMLSLWSYCFIKMKMECRF